MIFPANRSPLRRIMRCCLDFRVAKTALPRENQEHPAGYFA
jgi:hypothetical protein